MNTIQKLRNNLGQTIVGFDTSSSDRSLVTLHLLREDAADNKTTPIELRLPFHDTPVEPDVIGYVHVLECYRTDVGAPRLKWSSLRFVPLSEREIVRAQYANGASQVGVFLHRISEGLPVKLQNPAWPHWNEA